MTLRIALLAFALANCPATRADSFAVYSKVSAGWPKEQVTLSFLDSQTYQVLQSVDMGTLRDHNDVYGLYGPEKEYFYSVAPNNSNRKEAELVVFATESIAEIARLPMGEFGDLELNNGLGFARLTADGKRLIILRRANRRWHLDAYDRVRHELLASTELPRKLDGGFLFPNGNYAATYPTRNKKRELLVIDSVRGLELARHDFTARTELRFEFSKDSLNLLVFAARRVAIERQLRSHELIYGDVVYLHLLNIENGQISEGEKLGYEATPLFKAENNRYDYFGTRGSLEDEGLVLWRVDGSQVEKIVETDYLVSPDFALVSESASRAVFFHKQKTIFVDLEAGRIVAEDQIGIYPSSALLNSSGTLAYLKQDLTSKVGVVNLQQDKAIEVTRAGSFAKKLGYGSVALALSAGIASVTGGFAPWMIHPLPPDTSMLKDSQERYLYVINDQTDDITVLDAKSLKREKLLKVSDPLFMARQRNGESIWAFGEDEIALIDPTRNEIVLRYSEGAFAGAELALGRAYFANETGLKVVDTATGKVTATVKSLSNAYLVVH